MNPTFLTYCTPYSTICALRYILGVVSGVVLLHCMPMREFLYTEINKSSTKHFRPFLCCVLCLSMNLLGWKIIPFNEIKSFVSFTNFQISQFTWKQLLRSSPFTMTILQFYYCSAYHELRKQNFSIFSESIRCLFLCPMCSSFAPLI